jgi:hypothetical protein
VSDGSQDKHCSLLPPMTASLYLGLEAYLDQPKSAEMVKFAVKPMEIVNPCKLLQLWQVYYYHPRSTYEGSPHH